VTLLCGSNSLFLHHLNPDALASILFRRFDVFFEHFLLILILQLFGTRSDLIVLVYCMYFCHSYFLRLGIQYKNYYACRLGIDKGQRFSIVITKFAKTKGLCNFERKKTINGPDLFIF
jgi:hypothetical protein